MDDLTRLPSQSASVLTSSGSDWGRFAPGTLFAGRFRIVAPLGRGGMGEVYRADDLKLGQTVALKFLPDHLAHDPARLAQFHNEVRVARTISHRNVCRTYDIGDADGRPFLSMEYVDGEDLSSLLHRIGRFPQDKALEVARQICAGLAAAHERGVLHRDLKPANVMIDGDGHVRITDFGLAALAGSADNVRAGTPAYMAPEQLAGREVTPRSDIYALGLVLYELSPASVFEAKTLNERSRCTNRAACGRHRR
jgi:serine/threonine-protein kinase